MARSHSVGCGGSCIFEAVVAHVVGIERRVVLGIVLCDNGVLETCAFKRLVPVFDTCLDGLAPLFGESRVHVEHNWLLRLNELSGKILLHILSFRHQAPAAYVCLLVDTVGVGAENLLVAVEETHTVVLIAHRHRVVGQHEQRAVNLYRVRFLNETLRIERQSALNLDVLGESLHLVDARSVGGEGAFQRH